MSNCCVKLFPDYSRVLAVVVIVLMGDDRVENTARRKREYNDKRKKNYAAPK